jgi:hypothetical protein
MSPNEMRNERPYNFSKPRNWKSSTWKAKQQSAHNMVLVLKRKFLQPGVRFDTEFDRNCEVITPPNEHNDFTAFDSDHVKCTFNVEMVTKIHL